MRILNLVVVRNYKISNTLYKMVLSGNCADLNPGTFINIKLDGYFLRRPFAVADSDSSSMFIIYMPVGPGSQYMTTLKEGDNLETLAELGNGFNLSIKTNNPLLIGGGTGIAPIYKLAKTLSSKDPIILLGYRSACECYMLDEIQQFKRVILTTDDGTLGFKGNVLDYLKQANLNYDYYYACGPLPMLKAIAKFDPNGEMSLESHMGCGFGACMGCSIKTTNGFKRVCKEGPVFPASEVLFDE
jgi:dihydroorotate dehydrogenase electron transfer subunit